MVLDGSTDISLKFAIELLFVTDCFALSQPASLGNWLYVTLHGKTDTNAFPFKLQNRLLSVYIRLNGSWKRLNGLLIRLKKFASV